MLESIDLMAVLKVTGIFLLLLLNHYVVVMPIGGWPPFIKKWLGDDQGGDE